MKLVVIYGPPGVGKLTVSKELAKRTEYILFDNHKTQDWIVKIFGSEFVWKSKLHNNLSRKIRLDVIESAAEVGKSMIYTQGYGYLGDLEFAKNVVRKVKNHGREVCFVHPTAPTIWRIAISLPTVLAFILSKNSPISAVQNTALTIAIRIFSQIKCCVVLPTLTPKIYKGTSDNERIISNFLL